jgi:5-methyltetrahydropteroyltriglutamate--homocysteine methyltransferase
MTIKIPVTHAGSLPRPRDLTEMIWAKMDGKPVDPGALAARTASAVAEVVGRQRALGIDIVSDGEMSKAGFSAYIAERFDGFGGESAFTADDLVGFEQLAMQLFGNDAGAHLRMANCVGPVKVRQLQDVRRDIRVLKDALGDASPANAFMGSISPGQVALNYPNQYYDTFESYIGAVAQAIGNEYREIVSAGLSLEIDAPDLASAQHSHAVGETSNDFWETLPLRIESINTALEGIPAEQVRMHVCWGNYAGPHHLDVPLSEIISVILKAKVGTIYLEGANPRHEYEWHVFENVDLPARMKVILGAVDTKINAVEHPQTVADRLVRLARVIGPDRVIAGTDCGLATFIDFGVDSRVAWMKLESLVEGARLASEQLG